MTYNSCSRSAALIPRFTGGISVISSSMIIYMIFRSRQKLSTIYHRIMFGMSLADILTSVAMLLTTLPMPTELSFDCPTSFAGTRLGNRQTCEAQGFFFFFGYIAMFSYNGTLFLYYTCTIAFQMKEEQIVKYVEPLIHLIPWVLGLTVSIPPLVRGSIKATSVDAWCMVTSDIDKMVMILALVFFVTLIIEIILMLWKVYKLEIEMALLRDETPNNEQNSTLMRASQSLHNTKIIGKQALAYYLSFMISTSSFFARSVTRRAVPSFIIYMGFILAPLQGFFNVLIFVSHKVYNYRRVNSDISRLKVIKILLCGRSQDPILFSRISLLKPPVIELTDEFKNQILLVEKISGCGVEVDDKSQRDEDGLSGFIQHSSGITQHLSGIVQHSSGIVPTISNHNHTGEEHNAKITSNFNNSAADLSGFSVPSFADYSNINTEDQSISSSHLPLQPFNIEQDENSIDKGSYSS